MAYKGQYPKVYAKGAGFTVDGSEVLRQGVDDVEHRRGEKDKFNPIGRKSGKKGKKGKKGY